MTDKKEFPNIGKYEIIEKLGEGGFGMVYRGRDPMLDVARAIKVLKSDVATSPDFVERFRREARMAASLKHPNITTIIEVGEDEGRYFMVMDYLAGGPVSDLMQNGKPLPLAQVVELLAPIAAALDHAHSKGIVHRDIKPSNMLLDEDGKAVLTDFGLVKPLLDDSLTTSGATLGTKKYMAPEQIQGQTPSPAIDIYALGVVAYEMLTGQVPFDGTSFEIQKGHVEIQPPDPCTLNAELPREIADCLIKALAKNPTERYPSAGQFVAALQKILEELTRKAWEKLLDDAQTQMDAFEFDAAIASLEKAHAIRVTAQSEQWLQECQRRKVILNEVQELLQQNQQIHSRLADWAAAEVWLPSKQMLHSFSLNGLQEKSRKIIDHVTFALLVVLLVLVVLIMISVSGRIPVIPGLVERSIVYSYPSSSIKIMQRHIATPGLVTIILLVTSFFSLYVQRYVLRVRKSK